MWCIRVHIQHTHTLKQLWSGMGIALAMTVLLITHDQTDGGGDNAPWRSHNIRKVRHPNQPHSHLHAFMWPTTHPHIQTSTIDIENSFIRCTHTTSSSLALCGHHHGQNGTTTRRSAINDYIKTMRPSTSPVRSRRRSLLGRAGRCCCCAGPAHICSARYAYVAARLRWLGEAMCAVRLVISRQRQEDNPEPRARVVASTSKPSTTTIAMGFALTPYYLHITHKAIATKSPTTINMRRLQSLGGGHICKPVCLAALALASV